MIIISTHTGRTACFEGNTGEHAQAGDKKGAKLQSNIIASNATAEHRRPWKERPWRRVSRALALNQLQLLINRTFSVSSTTATANPYTISASISIAALWSTPTSYPSQSSIKSQTQVNGSHNLNCEFSQNC